MNCLLFKVIINLNLFTIVHFLILAAKSSSRAHQFVRMIQSYSRRRERLGPDGGCPNGGALELKMFLELSLNALKNLIWYLQCGHTISIADLSSTVEEVPVLIECAISEIIAKMRNRRKYKNQKIIYLFVYYTL